MPASPSQPRPSRLKLPTRVIVGMAACTLFGWFWIVRVEPYRLYHQAQREFPRNPQRVAALLESAVHQSGGVYPEAQLLWSRTFLLQGKTEDALGCFSVIQEPSKLKAEQLLVLAEEARRSSEFLLAKFALEAVTEQSPQWIDARHQLMELATAEGRYQETLALGASLAARHPELPLTAYLQAQAEEYLGDPHSAAQHYQNALRISERLGSEKVEIARRRLLRLSIQLGDAGLARHCLADLQERNPLTREDRLQQIELLRLEGDFQSAWAEVNNLLEKRPTDLAARQLRGTLAFDRGENELAERDLRLVLQAQPWNKLMHYKLAQLLQRTSRGDEAEKHFIENRRLTEISKRVIELQRSGFPDRERESARLRELANALTELGQTDSAARLRAHLQRVE